VRDVAAQAGGPSTPRYELGALLRKLNIGLRQERAQVCQADRLVR
jgi:hypothetical protein